MNWISNYVRPKINSLFSRREVPENLWTKCDECGQMLFHRELAEALNVCPNCGHHMYISPRRRFAHMFDGGVHVAVPVPEPTADPLHFRDKKRYTDRLKDARRVSEGHDAMLVAEGEIGRLKTVIAVQDYKFLSGSMGMYVGNALIAAAERAVAQKCPLVVFAAAGGARMQEGILSLMQMPRTTAAVQMLREAGLPYVVVLTHATTGGVTASYAMLGDIQIAEPGALICFAGPRVIEQTIRETLPEGFQRAEYLLDHGMLDRVTARQDLRLEIGQILHMLMGKPQMTAGDLPPPGPTVPEGAEGGAPDHPDAEAAAGGATRHPAGDDNAKRPAGDDTSKRPAGGDTASGDTSKRPAGGDTASGDTSKRPGGGDTAKRPAGDDTASGDTSKRPGGGDTLKRSAGGDASKRAGKGDTARRPARGDPKAPAKRR